MALPIWTILVATFGLFWYLANRAKQRKNEKFSHLKEIPGPKGLPIIGSAHKLGTFPNKQMTKWTQEYGDLFKVQLGNFTTVVVSDPKMAKELFSNYPALTGRLQAPEFSFYPDTPNIGMFNSEGERWEVHRRFLLRQLRDFGFGKSSMESLILDELKEVINMYKKQAGSPVGEIRETLKLAVVNSLWQILASSRFEFDDPKLLEFANSSSKKFNEIIEKGGLLIFLPWLAYVAPEWSGYNTIREVLEQNKDFFEPAVQEHKKNFKEGGELKDFIDVYLNEMKKHENDPTSTFYGKISERHLVQLLFDLFFAGNDTTAITTAWTILYLCKYPHVQKKLQKEIEEVTGNSRRVSVDDRPNMPYALALIDEILRFSSIVPDGVQHRAMADIEYKGYHIPKDALVQPNQKFIHYNPKIWGDPENFRPERFLTAEGKYKKNENLIAFQIGRRQCLGETLARDSIYLYMTNLFQQFEMKFDPNMEKEPGLDYEPGFLLAPLPYTVIMKDRLEGKL